MTRFNCLKSKNRFGHFPCLSLFIVDLEPLSKDSWGISKRIPVWATEYLHCWYFCHASPRGLTSTALTSMSVHWGMKTLRFPWNFFLCVCLPGFKIAVILRDLMYLCDALSTWSLTEFKWSMEFCLKYTSQENPLALTKADFHYQRVWAMRLS